MKTFFNQVIYRTTQSKSIMLGTVWNAKVVEKRDVTLTFAPTSASGGKKVTLTIWRGIVHVKDNKFIYVTMRHYSDIPRYEWRYDSHVPLHETKS